MGGRRAPSFYFFTPGYRHFQSNQQQSESFWGTLNQTGSAHDIISSKDQNQASFLTSWVLDGNQQPRRRDKRKCKWFTVLQISVEIQIKQSTMTLWWQAHFLYLPNRRHRWTTLHFLIRLNSQQWYWSMFCCMINCLRLSLRTGHITRHIHLDHLSCYNTCWNE